MSVNGALLVKTFGREASPNWSVITAVAGDVRDIGVRRAQVSQLFFMGLGLAGAIGTALIYWTGGYMVISRRHVSRHDRRLCRVPDTALWPD